MGCPFGSEKYPVAYRFILLFSFSTFQRFFLDRENYRVKILGGRKSMSCRFKIIFIQNFFRKNYEIWISTRNGFRSKYVGEFGSLCLLWLAKYGCTRELDLLTWDGLFSARPISVSLFSARFLKPAFSESVKKLGRLFSAHKEYFTR